MLSQMVVEPLRVGAGPVRKCGDALNGRCAIEVRSRRDEVVEHPPVFLEQCRRVADHLVETVECNAGESLRGMSPVDPEQIVEPPQALRELRLSEDPAAAQAAEP